MKRNMTLIVMMMLSSVAAAVASPEQPAHAAAVDCFEPQQLAVVSQPDESHGRSSGLLESQPAKASAVHRQPTSCTEDVTAPYRQLHHGGMKLAAGCDAAV